MQQPSAANSSTNMCRSRYANALSAWRCLDMPDPSSLSCCCWGHTHLPGLPRLQLQVPLQSASQPLPPPGHSRLLPYQVPCSAHLRYQFGNQRILIRCLDLGRCQPPSPRTSEFTATGLQGHADSPADMSLVICNPCNDVLRMHLGSKPASSPGANMPPFWNRAVVEGSNIMLIPPTTAEAVA